MEVLCGYFSFEVIRLFLGLTGNCRALKIWKCYILYIAVNSPTPADPAPCTIEHPRCLGVKFSAGQTVKVLI